MKFLLTSAGLSNNSIIEALKNLLDNPPEKIRLAFIPTAANVEDGDKSWLIDDLHNIQVSGYEIDIVDISAVGKDIWLPRLASSQILFFGGGNTFHLMHCIKKCGLNTLLPELLKDRIYAGISAGSCIAGPTIYNSVQNLFGEEYKLKMKEGLGLVNFQIIPHLNSPYFPAITAKSLEEESKKIEESVYAIDDQSAILVQEEKVEIVSEGEWFKFN